MKALFYASGLCLSVALDPLLATVARQAELVGLVPSVLPLLNLSSRLNVSFEQPPGNFESCSATYSFGNSSFVLSDLGSTRPAAWDARSYRLSSGLPNDLFRYAPTVAFETQPTEMYAVLMVNPLFLHEGQTDGPFLQHWMVINVPASGNLSAGEIVNPYLGPENLHPVYDAYMFVVYRQTANITLQPAERLSIQARTGFNLTHFVSTHNLGVPFAINWMFVKGDVWTQVQADMRGVQPLACAEAITLHEWVALDYDVSESTKEAWVANKSFIKENNALTGLKFWKGESYVTVPRWRPGVPSTLNKVVVNAANQSLLQPFPSVWFNSLANPQGVRYVQSMEIDSQGRMWILDTGRINFFSANASEVVNGPAFLVLLNIASAAVLRRYEFPAEVAPHDSVFLNDLVVDELREVAYISDTNTNGRGAVIVYDLRANKSRRFQDPSMLSEQESIISINGVEYPGVDTPMDGIALSPDTDTLYFCALRGIHLYSIPTRALRDFTLSADALSAFVTLLGTKASQSDGLAMTASGRLIFGALSLNNVYEWDPSLPLSSQTPLLAPDSVSGQWPDTFAFDDEAGALLFTTNRLQRFFFFTMDFTGAEGSNFRIQRVQTGERSYLSAQVAYVIPQVCPQVPECAQSHYTVLVIIIAVLGGALLVVLACFFRLSHKTKSAILNREPLLS